MGHSSLYALGAFLGFSVNAKDVFHLSEQYEHFQVKPDASDEWLQELRSHFNEFLEKKFGKRIPEGFKQMKFKLAYFELMAAYEITTYGYPYLLFGYNLSKIDYQRENLNSIGQVKISMNFPKNCHDIYVEFLEEYSAKTCKVSNDSGSEAEATAESKAKSKTKSKKATKTAAVFEVTYGIHKIVSEFPFADQDF